MLLILHILLHIPGDPCSPTGDILQIPGVNRSSPGYQADGSGAYPSNLTCKWIIQAPVENVRLPFCSYFRIC